MNKTNLEIRITRGKDWTNAIAKGDGEVFRTFSEK